MLQDQNMVAEPGFMRVRIRIVTNGENKQMEEVENHILSYYYSNKTGAQTRLVHVNMLQVLYGFWDIHNIKKMSNIYPKDKVKF